MNQTVLQEQIACCTQGHTLVPNRRLLFYQLKETRAGPETLHVFLKSWGPLCNHSQTYFATRKCFNSHSGELGRPVFCFPVALLHVNHPYSEGLKPKTCHSLKTCSASINIKAEHFILWIFALYIKLLAISYSHHQAMYIRYIYTYMYTYMYIWYIYPSLRYLIMYTLMLRSPSLPKTKQTLKQLKAQTLAILDSDSFYGTFIGLGF